MKKNFLFIVVSSLLVAGLFTTISAQEPPVAEPTAQPNPAPQTVSTAQPTAQPNPVPQAKPTIQQVAQPTQQAAAPAPATTEPVANPEPAQNADTTTPGAEEPQRPRRRRSQKNETATVDEKTLEEQEKAEEKHLMQEWETHMSDFVPADMITLEVAPRYTEILYEDVKVLPSRIRGAYFVSSSQNADIDFTILDPKKKTIFRRNSKKEGIFYFDAEQTGTFTFIFNNRKWLESKQLTLALHSGNSSEELLSSKDLTPMERSIQTADRQLREIQAETRFAFKRQETYYNTTKQSHNKVFYIAIIECLAILATTAWQVYYIKRLLDNRRII